MLRLVGEATPELADALWSQFEREPARDGWEIADAMKQAWLRYQKFGHMLRYRWGPKKFFGHNHWRNDGGWPIDVEMLKQYRNAGIGGGG